MPPAARRKRPAKGAAKQPPTDETLQKERQTLELRRAGVTFDVIADRLGFHDRGGAYKAYRRALARTLQEPADELRQTELDRLDRLHAAYWPQAMRGDVRAGQMILRIAERRARLLGLDAPEQVNVHRTSAEDAAAVHDVAQGVLSLVDARRRKAAGE